MLTRPPLVVTPRQAGSLGAFGSLLGDKAAEVTALAQQRLGALGTSAADSGGGLGMSMAFGDYVLSSAANTMGSAGGRCGAACNGWVGVRFAGPDFKLASGQA